MHGLHILALLLACVFYCFWQCTLIHTYATLQVGAAQCCVCSMRCCFLLAVYWGIGHVFFLTCLCCQFICDDKVNQQRSVTIWVWIQTVAAPRLPLGRHRPSPSQLLRWLFSCLISKAACTSAVHDFDQARPLTVTLKSLCPLMTAD